MTRSTMYIRGLAAVATAALFTAPSARQAVAQCCGAAPTAVTQTVGFAPTVAFSPVVATQPVVAAQPVVVVNNGWYPGRWFDQMRLRRWSNSTVVVPTQTVGVAQTHAVGFAPTQTVAFAPVATPYVTAFAPLQRTVVQASLMPVTAVPVTAAFAPTAVLSPGCGCAAEAPCSACASASTVVSQASFVQPSSGCSSCGESSGAPVYTTPSGTSDGISPIPATGTPELPADYSAPTQLNYGAAGTEVQKPSSPGNEEAKAPASDAAEDPGPEAEAEETDTSFQAPKLISPDRTVSRPTVGVHHAVYRQPARATTASTSTTPTTRTQAAIDAQGWHSAPRAQ